jgi:chorismate lyase/3-hydroxybenzoate synthase
MEPIPRPTVPGQARTEPDDGSHLGPPGSPRRPLAAIAYGGAPPGGAPLALRVELPWLGGEAPAERWTVPEEPRVSRRGAVALAAADAVAFAVVELPAGAGDELEAAARRAFDELLAVTAGAGYPHLLRMWSVVPRINEVDGGLERYRRFCRARAEAFEAAYGAGFEWRLPASTGVGSPRGGLVVYLLACREPADHRENPRQVAAWAYPACYGPRSPSFARASLGPAAAGGHLLISGTASIVGPASVHPGSLRHQTLETLRNLRELLAGRGAPPGRPFRHLKVYLRRPGDRTAVEAELRRQVGERTPLLFLQADLCRRELLVEIEGVA